MRWMSSVQLNKIYEQHTYCVFVAKSVMQEIDL